jgi:TRAP-type C4-dicarboxylate transport system permease small subunit
MKRLLELESAVIRVEGHLCVVLVLVMLVLAGYNVLYRNALVPLQSYWAHSGPPVAATVAPDAAAKAGAKADAKSEGKASPKTEAGGFGGAFGADPQDEVGEDGDTQEDAEEEEDDTGGFGGAFGKPAKEPTPDEKGDDFFVADEFDDLPDINPAGGRAGEDDGGPQGGPPPEGSFAAWGVDFVGAVKLDWIDVFLRQLVIIVSFLGAAIATQRHKHINIDALSKLLSERRRRLVSIATNALAIAVCLVLANAGMKLVSIGLEYPRELVPFADQWMFQLMFPIGFSLLGFHFGVRLIELTRGGGPTPAASAPASSRPPAETEEPPEEEEERR